MTEAWAVWPDQTYFISSRLGSNSGFVEVVESYPTFNNNNLIINQSYDVSESLVEGVVLTANKLSPALVARSLTGNVYFFNHSPLAQTTPESPLTTASTIALASPGQALLVQDQNSIVLLDDKKSIHPLAPHSWLDQNQFGQIRQIQMIGPNQFVVLTDRYLVKAEFSPPHSPRIIQTILLMPPGHSLTGPRLNILNFPGGFQTDQALCFVSDETGVWLLQFVVSIGTNQLERAAVYYDWKTGAQQGIGTSLPNLPATGLQALDFNGQQNRNLIIKSGSDLVEISHAGGKAMQYTGVFSTRVVPKFSAQQISSGHLVVDHPQDGMNWSARTGGHSVALAAPVPANPGSSVKKSAPQSLASAPIMASVNPTPLKVVFEPKSFGDFEALFKKELPSLPAQLTVKEFADHWINATDTLKYYFRLVPPKDLEILGLKTQGYWVVPVPGKESQEFEIKLVLWALSDAKADEDKRLACESALMTNAKP